VPGDASFTRSFDPCTLILTMLRGESPGGGAFDSASRKGKLGQPRRTFTGAGTDGRSAARRVPPLPQGRRRGTAKKRKEIEVSVPARIERARVWLPARRNAVAEVGRRRLASNKLGKRAPKRAAGSSERGPSTGRKSAGDTVGGRIGRRVQSRVGLTAKTGEDRRKTQGDERSSFSGLHIAKSGAEVAGPGL